MADSNGQPNGNALEGLYEYQTTFMVGGGPVSLSGVWAVDNSATMYLNGHVVSTIADPGFNVLTPFAASNQSWFINGVNTLTFDVHNDLGDHFKSGQQLSVQNRPTEVAVQD